MDAYCPDQHTHSHMLTRVLAVRMCQTFARGEENDMKISRNLVLLQVLVLFID